MSDVNETMQRVTARYAEDERISKFLDAVDHQVGEGMGKNNLDWRDFETAEFLRAELKAMREGVRDFHQQRIDGLVKRCDGRLRGQEYEAWKAKMRD